MTTFLNGGTGGMIYTDSNIIAGNSGAGGDVNGFSITTDHTQFYYSDPYHYYVQPYYPANTFPFTAANYVAPLTVDLNSLRQFKNKNILQKWLEFISEFSLKTKKQKLLKALLIFTNLLAKQNMLDEDYLNILKNDILTSVFKLPICKNIECWNTEKKETAHMCKDEKQVN